MTPKEVAIEFRDSLRRRRFFEERELIQLAEDSLALRELVEALPRCDDAACQRVALKVESGGMCDDFNLRYWCEEHTPGDVVDADWAPIIRRLGL